MCMCMRLVTEDLVNKKGCNVAGSKHARPANSEQLPLFKKHSFPAENQSLAVKSRGRKGFGPGHSVPMKGGGSC